MFKTENELFHPIVTDDLVDLPEQFTYPFYYQPHSLCIKASEEVKAYLNTQTDFTHNFGLGEAEQVLKIGKMFGVMVVQTQNGVLGYITAFSGKLAESNYLKGFVPPIYDTLNKEGFYKQGEAKTNILNEKIETLEVSSELHKAKINLEQTKLECKEALEAFKKQSKTQKQLRQQERVEAEEKLSISEKEILFENLRQLSIQTNLKLKYLKLDCENRINTAEKISPITRTDCCFKTRA